MDNTKQTNNKRANPTSLIRIMPKSKQREPRVAPVMRRSEAPGIIHLPINTVSGKLCRRRMNIIESMCDYVSLDLSGNIANAMKEAQGQLFEYGRTNVNKLLITPPYFKDARNEEKWNLIESIICGEKIIGWKPDQLIFHEDASNPIFSLIDEKYEDNIEDSVLWDDEFVQKRKKLFK
jgi:hypothetical protein